MFARERIHAVTPVTICSVNGTPRRSPCTVSQTSPAITCKVSACVIRQAAAGSP